MKKLLPDNVLLVLAVMFTGLMIFYNLELRDTFGVRIAYKYPGIPEPQPIRQAVVTDYTSDDETEDGDEIDESYARESFDEEVPLTSVTFPLNINHATEEELRFIPQVGNVMAQRIVQYRDVLGGYKSLDQLKEIKGVGDATFDNISAYLIIDEDGG